MIKQKIKLYFDTSILLALVDDPTKNQEKKLNHTNTLKLWELLH
jgi:hypothetical protein